MPITLAEAKVGMADKVDQQVIDVFRRSSLLLDNLTFDDTVSPGTGGSTLTYGYIQLQTPSTANVRAINSEYTANEAKRAKKSASLVVMGGSWEIDRVLQDSSGAIDEMAFQAEEKTKAVANYFHYLAINGQAASGNTGGYVGSTFDGLKKSLVGASTEQTTTVDISTSALMDSNANALLDEVDGWLSTMDGLPTMLLMNTKMLTKFRGIARRAGYYSQSRDDFGRTVETYNGIMLMDAGQYYTGSATVDTIATDGTKGTTDIYAVQLGLTGFHGISLQGGNIVRTYLPNMTDPKAVKTGEVELVAGVVLKNTLKAGVLHGVKVAAGSE